MGYYPIAVDLTDRSCLVVGGGEVALRKVKALLEAGACVRVIAPEIDPRIAELKGVSILRRNYQPGDITGYSVIFAATGDKDVNASIFEEARRVNILTNVADDPELCSFIVPSIVRRGDLIIAISTSGKSPALAKRIRKQIEASYGREYALLVDILGEMREIIKSKYSSQPEREVAFNALLDVGILEMLKDGKEEEARKKALGCI